MVRLVGRIRGREVGLTPHLNTNPTWAGENQSRRSTACRLLSQASTMSAFTLFHVALSLVGIVAGFAAVFGLLASKLSPVSTPVFLWATLATTVTGFMFPFNGFTPAFNTGIVSLLALAPVFYALYAKKLAGAWRVTYVIGAIFAFYLNFFVLIVQSFLKIPVLHALAPTQKEPPFALAQGAALLLFIAFGILATRRFHPAGR